MLTVTASSTAAVAYRRLTPRALSQQIRCLNIYEYIGMEIMSRYGIATPKWRVAKTISEAEHAYSSISASSGSKKDVVIKAQVVSCGRGLGTFDSGFKGGVHMITKDREQASEIAGEMLGSKLITKQAPRGLPCNAVLLVERIYLRREMYLSIFIDSSSQMPVMVGSPFGGTSIGDITASNPGVIFTSHVDIMEGIRIEQCKEMAHHLGFAEGSTQAEKAMTLMKNLYAMFLACDCTQIEVNPLAETHDGEVVVCDAKVNFDDNAKFRQKAIFANRDYSQEDAREVEASKYGLNYIGLDGNIGCMVNGAGLAMGTMDIIQLKGGSPANFLDVGGGADEVQVQKAFEILNADRNVQAILVNIFGGIMRCDVIAAGIINAARDIGMKKPIVLRLQGTNVEAAKKIIDACGFHMILVENLEDAAVMVVGVAEIAKQAESLKIGIKFEGLGL